MTSQLLTVDSADIEIAANHLKQGDLVVFPTDTVYGVGVDAFNSDAIAALYAAKRRPISKGLPILLADASALELVAHVPTQPAILALIERYWPGPLTLILPRKSTLPANLSPNDGVAVRIPDHNVARQLIRLAGGALATSSANVSGQPAATNALTAAQQLGDCVAAIVNGATSQIGLSSTIIDCTTTPPRILREGPIPAAQLLSEATS